MELEKSVAAQGKYRDCLGVPAQQMEHKKIEQNFSSNFVVYSIDDWIYNDTMPFIEMRENLIC